MNTHRSATEFTSNASLQPQNLGFVNTIVVNLHDEIKELAEDQNGMVTHLRSHWAPLLRPIVLKPQTITPRHISQLLHHKIGETLLSQALGEKIARRCVDLPGPFLLNVHVTLIREVRIMLPSVSVPSKAASSDVFQRLVEEQTVESVDLGKEEQTCLVCLEDLSESSSNNIIRMPKCLHLFHQDCIFEWLRHQNSCPLCRRVPYDQVHETE
ncbi:E3 ubiquitin-protein ligase ATL15 [Cardamine amara subsp. amara]|uniref:E3 ubiquitin-protein ligase ATL15 n=1 Tax=Cardamine amara subsp. amara TaxID=228776 RepID=A0ABD1C6Z1_CARAN